MSAALRLDDYRDRRPPQSEDAEVAVLGAVLMDPDTIMAALALIDDTAFYAEKHRKLFRAMVTLTERGTTIDPLTLADLLEQRGELQAAGGKDYIGFLVDAVPTSANVRYHAGIVREKANLRRVLETAQTMQQEAFAGTLPASHIAQQGFDALLPISVEATGSKGFVKLKDTLWPVMEAVEAMAAGKVGGIRTGYTQIDAETGGMQDGEFVVLGGAEGMGKSALALNLALRVASANPTAGGGACGYVSAEMSKEAIAKRALAWCGRIDGRKLRTGQLVDGDFPALAKAGGILSHLPFWIDDEAEPSLSDVTARCAHLKATHPELRLIVVDFLQLVRVRGSEGKRHEQLTEIAYALKGMAKRLGIVVVAPCQVNSKEVEDGKDMRPQLKDLQGASGMRQAADFVGLLFRPAVYNALEDPRVLEVYFAKCREASPFRAILDWNGPTLTIEDRRR